MSFRFRPYALTTALLFTSSLSWAHARPKAMVPAAESTGPAPQKIVVTFTEAVEPKFSSLSLTSEAGVAIKTEHSQGDPGDAKTLTLPVPALSAGGYLVHWVSVAPDGHRMQGEYKFSVK
ncbi:MAG: copper resistance protein CopC [Edaphobacter sp.]|uniref:copper resistance protein CopC n=1 Tax=Edaphobacter sp. TaxID=1934404 RepID=UPI0023A1F026|nr:copper resistance protein CopC [Edaphobacter sp.]MDE1175322.1 copper resistance protein CopC [Edaphobacter sp.]